MPPLPAPTPEIEMTTDDSSKGSSNNQMPQPLLPDDVKLDASAVDLEKGLGGGTRDGKYLRWARITKEVEIKEGNR